MLILEQYSGCDLRGKVKVEGEVAMVKCSVRRAKVGVKVDDGATLALTDSKVELCASAAVLVAEGGEAIIVRCRLRRSQRGCYVKGKATLEECEVTQNRGDGVHAAGEAALVEVLDCASGTKCVDNDASSWGGADWRASGGGRVTGIAAEKVRE